MSLDEQDNIPNETEKRPFDAKGFFIRLIVSFVVAALLSVAVMLFELFGPSRFTWQDNAFRILSDSFSVAGVLTALFWCLGWASSKGAFDLLVYSTRKMLSFMFRWHPENSNLPSTYADYVEMKHGGEKKPFHGELLYVGALFLLIGIIFALIEMA